MSDPNTYPRESVEFQPVQVKVDGEAVTTGVELALALGSARPVDWQTPTTLDGKIGVMVTGLDVGTWHVWARVTSAPETPVIDCGYFRVT